MNGNRAGGCIIALDQGTTSSRAVVFDSETINIKCIRNRQLTQYYPHPAWVEQDPEEIWRTQLESLIDAVAASGTALQDAACLGITNQRETVVVWDKKTGEPVYNAIVWQWAALFGQACFMPGSVKNTYGTGCFILMNTGGKPVISKNRLLSAIAWVIEGKPEYALEGSVFNAGSAIQWLRDELKLIDSAPESDALAEMVPDTGGVYVVQASALHIGISAADYTTAPRSSAPSFCR